MPKLGHHYDGLWACTDRGTAITDIRPAGKSECVKDDVPGTMLVLLRGLRRRCPWCGQRKLFVRWFRLLERCPRCGLRLDAGEGAFLGAMAINYGVAGVLFLGILVATVAVTAPDVPVLPLLLVGLLVTVLSILFFYPFSKTIWAAIDLLLHRNRADRARYETARGDGPVDPL
jgi:uncharacterized protein (DUF983 family)